MYTLFENCAVFARGQLEEIGGQAEILKNKKASVPVL
jgi:hypothetical protein